jgi:hypothetical protein
MRASIPEEGINKKLTLFFEILGIPVKLNAHSEGKPNDIPG